MREYERQRELDWQRKGLRAGRNARPLTNLTGRIEVCDNKGPKKRNFVAKHARKFTKGGPHRDRTKYIRKEKHRQDGNEET